MNMHGKILLVDHDHDHLLHIERLYIGVGFQLECAPRAHAGVKGLQNDTFHASDTTVYERI